jgi:hypothetical protein
VAAYKALRIVRIASRIHHRSSTELDQARSAKWGFRPEPNDLKVRFGEKLRAVVEEARSKGCTSLRQVAEHLNSQGFSTPRGGRWAPASVTRLLGQLTPRAAD